jgi:hypothetical protein
VFVYANLRVEVEGKVHYAWRVQVQDGKVTIYTDLQDGGGSYAEEGPVLRIDSSAFVQIDASF